MNGGQELGASFPAAWPESGAWLSPEISARQRTGRWLAALIGGTPPPNGRGQMASRRTERDATAVCALPVATLPALSFHGGEVFAVLASGASLYRGAIPHQSASQGATRGRPA